MSMPDKTRYAELDWLRVILIFAVFLHHALMPFNGDDWHIMNSTSSKLLDDIMVYFEQLRLPLLFFIAGAGSLILLRKVSAKQFLFGKFNRLFIPLIAAILLIVPPQMYFEAPQQYDSIGQAYLDNLTSFNSNHLWFIEFLLVFMIIAPLLVKVIDAPKTKMRLTQFSHFVARPYGLLVVGIVLVAIRCGLKLINPEQGNDFSNVSVSGFYLAFFVVGMIAISQANIWQAFLINRRINLYAFTLTSIVFFVYYLFDFSDVWSLSTRWQIWWGVGAAVTWTGLLTFLGYLMKFCNHSPFWLRRTNEMIYPFYILHQTVIVIFAYYVVQLDLSITTKAILLATSSFAACAAICCLIVWPFKPIRLMFGLKSRYA